MNNNLTNKNQLTIEKWFTNKNQVNNINDKEIQRFKSNVQICFNKK